MFGQERGFEDMSGVELGVNLLSSLMAFFNIHVRDVHDIFITY